MPLLLLLIFQNLGTSWECHSLSSQYSQYNSHRARARGVTAFDRSGDNAIDFDYLTSNLPYSANEIRALSTLSPFPTKPQLTVSESGKLTCSFDDEMEFCSWHNSQNTDLKFWKGKLDRNFDPQRLESFSSDRNFLLAGGEPIYTTAAIEAELPCQYGDADINFDFWTNTLLVQVRYCLAKLDSEFLDCQMIPRVGNPLNFAVPTTADGLKIRIEVINLDSDSIVLIDNLRYSGQICEIVDESVELQNSLTTSQIPTLITGTPSSDLTVQKFFEDGTEFGQSEKRTTTGPSSDFYVNELTPCSALTCTFNDGDSCFYGLSGAGSTSTWNLSDRLVGNRHTGIQRINLEDQQKVGFAYVGNDYQSEIENIFVAESPKFTLKKDIFLVFDVYIRSITPKLKVCIDNFDDCPYESPFLDSKQFWQSEQKVALREGARKVFFVADNIKKHQFLAIDNVRLENIDGSKLC